MPKSPAKIQPTAFKASIGFLLGLAIFLACVRTYFRRQKFRRFFPDDYFLFIATLSLTMGTTLIYINLPYTYTQVNVEGGEISPPADFLQQAVRDEKLLDAAVVFLWLAIFGVKFSFLFLFQSLISRLRALTVWWWCVFAVLVPVWAACECSQFIVCPVFGPTSAEACVTPRALVRENATVKFSTILDILTDVMLISIPTMLLWRVKIPLHKKLALGFLLCLSFIPSGRRSIPLGEFFWHQAEAAVAVIAVSLAMFRSLFVADGSKNLPQHKPRSPPLPTSYKKLRTKKTPPQIDLPTLPSATFSRGTMIASQARESRGSEDVDLPMQSTGILVTQDFSSKVVRKSEPIAFRFDLPLG
ncbi:hypothetical protein MMC22_003339 [Lobaria immixta]|nr:hypothetical protein [Lobaria immixta]